MLTLRFLKEIYTRLDRALPVRAAFLAHGQETADHIRTYLMLMDERNLLIDLPPEVDLQITTLHGIANEFVNYDAEGIEPLSLDGSEGRLLQFELVQSLIEGLTVSAKQLATTTGEQFQNCFTIAEEVGQE